MRLTALAILVQLVLVITVSAAPVVAQGGAVGGSTVVPGGTEYARTGVHHGERVAAAAQPTFTGNKHWVILRCAYKQDWASRPDVRNNTAYFNKMFSAKAPGLAHYWNTVSYGNITISHLVAKDGTKQWLALPQNNTAYGHQDGSNNIIITASFDQLAADCASAWDHVITFNASTYYAFTLDQTPGACGVGGMFDIGGRDGVQFARGTLIGNCQDDEALWTHEMGHAFGLQHSESRNASGNTLYNTAYDIMSAPSGNCGSLWDFNGFNQPRVDRTFEFGCIPGQPLAYHKAVPLGWIPGSRVFVADGGRDTITLSRLAGPIPANSNFLMARIPINASTYFTVEARIMTGISDTLKTRYDENIPYNDPANPCCYENGGAVPVQGMIVINRITSDPYFGTRIRLQGTDNSGEGWWDDPGTNWVVGETFSAAGGAIKVKVLSITKAAIRVRITSP